MLDFYNHQQLCIPTDSLFSFSLPDSSSDFEREPSISSSDDSSALETPIDDMSSPSLKRSGSPNEDDEPRQHLLPQTKPRGQRISVKDFVPPDVSGLTKREARLVKNRAAAFLSRQRKREEFEQMEVRLREMERENARLLTSSADAALLSELESLRARLSASEEHAQRLSTELQRIKSQHIKLDSPEQVPFRPPPGSRGMLALLCALPSLVQPSPASQYPYAQFGFPNTMSLVVPTNETFDIAIDTAAGDGKTRVRVLAANSAPTSPMPTPMPPSPPASLGAPSPPLTGMSTEDFLSSLDAFSAPLSTPVPPFDPFNPGYDFSLPLPLAAVHHASPIVPPRQHSPLVVPSSSPVPRRCTRVRLRMRALPSERAEGGEWDVELA